MITREGVPTNIYREGDPVTGEPDPYVQAVLLDGRRIVARYSTNDPPCPGVATSFESPDGLNWYCPGSNTAQVIEVLREDFTVWQDASSSADTGPWRSAFLGAGTSHDIDGTNPGDARGVIRLQTSATSGGETRLAKADVSITQPSGGGLWWRGRVTPAQTSSIECEAGLANTLSTITDRASFKFASGSSPNWIARIEVANVFTQLVLPHVVTAHDWDVLELVLDGAQKFCKFYVNGEGPYVITTNAPTAALTPLLEVKTSTSSARHLYADYVYIDAITGDIRNPAGVPPWGIEGA